MEVLEDRWCPAIALVQNIGTVSASISGSITVTKAVTAGDTVIVELAIGEGTPTVKDSVGNIYTKDVARTASTDTAAIFSSHIVKAIPAGGTITVTSQAGLIATAQEFSGLAANPLDRTQSASGNSKAPSSGFTSTTTQANELLIGAFYYSSAPGTVLTAGAGYTALPGTVFVESGTDFIQPEFRVVTATGSYQANGTLSSTPNLEIADIATFFAAASPPTKVPHFGR